LWQLGVLRNSAADKVQLKGEYAWGCVVSKSINVGGGKTVLPNRLYFGDNLDWLPKIDAESVDLVYPASGLAQ
jgi:hypothetical protein